MTLNSSDSALHRISSRMILYLFLGPPSPLLPRPPAFPVHLGQGTSCLKAVAGRLPLLHPSDLWADVLLPALWGGTAPSSPWRAAPSPALGPSLPAHLSPGFLLSWWALFSFCSQVSQLRKASLDPLSFFSSPSPVLCKSLWTELSTHRRGCYQPCSGRTVGWGEEGGVAGGSLWPEAPAGDRGGFCPPSPCGCPFLSPWASTGKSGWNPGNTTFSLSAPSVRPGTGLPGSVSFISTSPEPSPHLLRPGLRNRPSHTLPAGTAASIPNPNTPCRDSHPG